MNGVNSSTHQERKSTATLQEVRVPVETPEVFPEAGYYPTEYVMRYCDRDDVYEISLEGMKWFEGQ